MNSISWNLPVWLSIALILQFTAVLSHAAQVPNQQPPYVPNEVIVKFRPGTAEFDKAMARSRVSGIQLRAFRIIDGLEHHRLPANVSVEQAIATYRQDPDVLYAEPNYIVRTTNTPNDPRFSELWGLNNVGQSGGTPDADIDAPAAWDLTTGDKNVVVAVLDTGIDYNHQDLSANMFRNTLDCNANGIDDDGNGFVDDCFGIDVANNDSNPMDDNNHGSHVAGTIGAVGNNNTGVVGINWNVSLMACKFFDANGSGTTAGAIACLEYVKTMKERGVNIVATNNSWGGGDFSQALFDAIQAHQQLGILFIAAAGNGDFFGFPINNDQTPFYPCTYELPNIICVAATTRTDDRASFSNYGRRTVHIGAPGYEILSTTRNNSYATFNGTSMATPHVTGVAALLKAGNPNWDWRAIKNLILSGGDGIASMSSTITQKRLNAYGALACSNSRVFSRLRPILDTVIGDVGVPVKLSVLNINCADPNGDVAVSIEPGGQVVILLDDGVGTDQASGDGIYSGVWSPPGTGNFTLTFPDGSVVKVSVSVPTIAVTPTALDFGTVNVGTSLTNNFTVKNIGSGNLTGQATAAAPYEIVSGGNYSLAAGQSQTVAVRFTPPSSGTFLSTVNFSGGGDASAPVSGAGVVPANIALSFDGKLRDRVGRDNLALSSDGSLDATFSVVLQAGSRDRAVTRLTLTRSGNTGTWNTVNDTKWALGAAASLDAALFNGADSAVNFPVSDGGSFNVFAADAASGSGYFTAGSAFTLTAAFSDGSSATASTTIQTAPPPPTSPTLALSFNGKLRDRVGRADAALSADGALDGTFTGTLQPGSGNRTITRLTLTRNSGGTWNTITDTAWALGAASSLDAALYNAANASVNFTLSDGGSFNVFAADAASGSGYFTAGSVFTLTAAFSDGSSATASTTIQTAPPPPTSPTLALSFDGKLRDRVGRGNLALSLDGSLDATFTAVLQAGSGDRTVTRLTLTRSNNSGTWNTLNDTKWALGAANSLDATLYNGADSAVNFPLTDGGSFNIFAADAASGSGYFTAGSVFTLTAGFSDGSSASVAVTIAN
jgi:subtilase family protein/fervidolysin-like protein/HYDIN/CFA65/VesB family protein